MIGNFFREMRQMIVSWLVADQQKRNQEMVTILKENKAILLRNPRFVIDGKVVNTLKSVSEEHGGKKSILQILDDLLTEADYNPKEKAKILSVWREERPR